ncbi:MAG: SpoIID/LytB domain-containing protein [Bdellovibrionales bacterium]
MKATAAAVLASSLLLTPLAQGGSGGVQEVRVRVGRSLKMVVVRGLDLQILAPGHPLRTGVSEPRTARVSKVEITRLAGDFWQLEWPSSGERERIQAPSLTIKGVMVRMGVKPVPNVIEILPDRGREIDVIARLDVETYLAGVIPAEMPVSWPLEALKAQAVAARSFALRMALERRKQAARYDVESTVLDQVYQFADTANRSARWEARLQRVLGETRGEVLKAPNGRILKAFYSADCGCQSEDPKFVWGELKSFESVKDPTCESRKPTTWDLTVKRSQVRERLVAALDLPATAELRALHVGSRTPSGRVAQVVASLDVDENRRRFFLSAQEFRKIFGFDEIRSTNFTLQWMARDLRIQGTGLGHGVGLCQLGAKTLAEEGKTYREILKLYYPRASLRKTMVSAVAGPSVLSQVAQADRVRYPAHIEPDQTVNRVELTVLTKGQKAHAQF